MFSVLPLLIAFFLVESVAASPIRIRENLVSLPFILNLNLSGSTLPDIDRARANALRKNSNKAANGRSTGKREVVSVDAANTAITYTAIVGVGTPATNYTLLIDTGSSNTWVGSGKPYIQTSSSRDLGSAVSVTYGSGMFSGEEFVDTVTLAAGLVIENQGIGSAHLSQGFNDVDGILGIGPVDLTLSTLSNASQMVPTVTDNLFQQGKISSNLVAVSYSPITQAPSTNGELTFGGVDSTKFTGSISFAPITSTSPASEFWGVDQTITYGDGTSVLPSTAGIVDTGTTLVLLASDALQTYQQLTGASLDDTTGLLELSDSQFANLQSLSFHIGDRAFVLTPDAQIWPRSLNSAIGGKEGSIYLVVSDLGTVSGQGLDFINGYTFLERFYSVFDTGNRRVGLATTINSQAQTN